MKERLRKLMVGRYGPDNLYKALIVVSIALMLFGIVIKNTLFNYLGLIVFVIAYVRVFSKNIGARYRENEYYKNIITSFKTKIKKIKKSTLGTKTHVYLKCPSCDQKLRVPRGKGRINIKCPDCNNTFVRKT